MFPDAKLKPLPIEESYALVGKEAQQFFLNKMYNPARRGDKLRERTVFGGKREGMDNWMKWKLMQPWKK